MPRVGLPGREQWSQRDGGADAGPSHCANANVNVNALEMLSGGSTGLARTPGTGSAVSPVKVSQLRACQLVPSLSVRVRERCKVAGLLSGEKRH